MGFDGIDLFHWSKSRRCCGTTVGRFSFVWLASAVAPAVAAAVFSLVRVLLTAVQQRNGTPMRRVAVGCA